jgi:tetratricopeptide (TPR) repeat protein
MKVAFAAVVLLLALLGCKDRQEARAPQQAGWLISAQKEVAFLKEVLARDPKNLNAWVKLGNLSMDMGRCDEAVVAYQKALELNPRDVNVRVDMGTCYRRLGQPERAVQEYRKAVSIDPGHLYGHKNMAIVLTFDLRDARAAEEALGKYERLNPRDPDIQRLRQAIERLKGLSPSSP